MQVLLVVVAADDDRARAGRRVWCVTSGTPTPSRRSARSRFMYSIVLAANASSCVDSPARASVIAASTVAASCAMPSARTRAVLGEQLVAVEPDVRALLDGGEDLAPDVVERAGCRR